MKPIPSAFAGSQAGKFTGGAGLGGLVPSKLERGINWYFACSA